MDEEPGTKLILPRAVVYSLLLALPTLIASAAWFTATQANDARHIADSFASLQKEVYDRRLADDAAAHAQSDQNGMLRDRLTRIEAQLQFLVATATPTPVAVKR